MKLQKLNILQHRNKDKEPWNHLGETNKRKRGTRNPPKRSRKTGSDTIAYLTERTEKEFEMREKELQQKREEMDLLRGLALQNTNAQSSPSASKQQLSDIQHMLQLQQQQQMQMQQQFMIQKFTNR